MNSRDGTIHSRLRAALQWINAFGFDPVRLRSAVKNLPATVRDYRRLSTQNKGAGEAWPIDFRRPCFHDRDDSGGTASGHYFHQDLLVARRIFERNPERHIDVGSRVDGFVAHVAVFREIEVFDIRPVTSTVKNMKFVQSDITRLDPEVKECCDSISSLHAIEHFGLGRYGDTIDIDGYKKGFLAISRMLRPGGILYLSVPIGRERIEFNGQRVFSVKRILDIIASHYELIAFSYVDDEGDLHDSTTVPLDIESIGNQLEFGCGIFELRKLLT